MLLLRIFNVCPLAVLVGVVMVNGLPIAHHVFSGDLVDHETVRVVMKDVGKRFEVERVVWVGDRGMVMAKTISVLNGARSRIPARLGAATAGAGHELH